MPELATLFIYWASLNRWPIITTCNCGAENAGVEHRAFRRFWSRMLSRNATKRRVRERPEPPHRQRKFTVTRRGFASTSSRARLAQYRARKQAAVS